MNEGVFAVAGSVAFLLLILWHMPNLWKICEGIKKVKREKTERGRTAPRRKQSGLQADPEIRQKELEIEVTLEKLATCQHPPGLKLLKEIELNKKMLELQLLAAPLGKEDRRQLEDEMTTVRGQIEKQKKKLNMRERLKR